MTKLSIAEYAGPFAEDKDIAQKLRKELLEPALLAGDSIVIDFKGSETATQSFVHALLSEVIRSNGDKILDRISFKDCSNKIKAVVKTVVQYTLESLEEAKGQEGAVVRDAPAKKPKAP